MEWKNLISSVVQPFISTIQAEIESAFSAGNLPVLLALSYLNNLSDTHERVIAALHLLGSRIS